MKGLSTTTTQQHNDALRHAADVAHHAADGLARVDWQPLRSWPCCAHPRQAELDAYRSAFLHSGEVLPPDADGEVLYFGKAAE